MTLNTLIVDDPTDFEIVVETPSQVKAAPRGEEDEATHPHVQGPLHRTTPSG